MVPRFPPLPSVGCGTTAAFDRSAGRSFGPSLPVCPRRPPPLRGPPRGGSLRSAPRAGSAPEPRGCPSKLPIEAAHRSCVDSRAMTHAPDFRLENSELRSENEFEEFASEDLPYYSDWHGSFEKLPWAFTDEMLRGAKADVA